MKISIVIPTIGREKYLNLALQSVVNQIEPFDEIVVFDNSISQDIEIDLNCNANSKITIIRSGGQLDPICSWNRAVQSCSNEYVAILGDDDIATAKFSIEIRRSLQYSDVVIARAEAIDENGIKTQDLPYPEQEVLDYCDFFEKRLTGNCSLFVPGLAFSKKIFNSVGGFSNTNIEGCAYSDELLLFSMCLMNSKIAITREVCWSYRIHSGQIAGVKSIEDVLNTSCKYIEKFEETLINLCGKEERAIYCGVSSFNYLIRVVRYRLTLFSQFAALNSSFITFQLMLVRELYGKRKIKVGQAVALHLAATKIYLKNTKAGRFIKKLIKK